MSGNAADQLIEQGRGENVKGWPGQVHRVIRQEALVVFDDQRVRQLDAKLATMLLGERTQLGDEFDSSLELQVIRKDWRLSRMCS